MYVCMDDVLHVYYVVYDLYIHSYICIVKGFHVWKWLFKIIIKERGGEREKNSTLKSLKIQLKNAGEKWY